MMSKGVRLSEKWFNRALWLVAFVFAWFLTGLGKSIIGDLPRVEAQYTLEHFVNHVTIEPLRTSLKETAQQRQRLNDQLEQASLQLTIRQKDYQAARSTFDNWVATRDATRLSTQDDELVRRTQQLDALKVQERNAEKAVETIQQKQTNMFQYEAQLQAQINGMEEIARKKLDQASQHQATRVFLYRLLLTLPLLALAAWLFAMQRKSQYWPFVWGFIIFALMAFFVELVPYLPDYGGYVRYLVGIVLTVVGGKYAIAALQHYLEQQRLAESQPEFQRREELGYDTALERLGKNICPGCERQVDLKSEHHDFCMHCGICLHNYCGGCQARKNAFAKFCHKCGTVA
ncbi:zinc ribbon domain-containing protein [Methylophilus sp. 5]|uniref:zinc ribbon domain-containing protein n=1 Tax=Methylophilus sp. 5 TaxID=1112274 RepID=UPI0004B57463|nr:zinc ribbon domain-containing protein [Methylophilus sp. 5]